MGKLWTVIFAGALFLAACNGNADEEAAEADDGGTGEEPAVEEETEEETVEEETEEAAEEEPAEEETAEDAGSASSDDRSTGGTEDLAGEEIDEADLQSAYNTDDAKIAMIEEAVETELTVEEVLKDPSEVTSYVHDTSIIIEITEDGTVLDQQFQGIIADVNESDGIEVASDYFDENYNILGPYGYANSETGEVLVFEQDEWMDYSSAYEADELVYGVYSNLNALAGEMSDLLEVLETDDYHLLYYSGNDMAVYDLYNESFEVEFTGADMDEIELGFIAFINKATGDLESANLISMAPGQTNPNELLTLEIILNYADYGVYDDAEIRQPSE